MGILNVITSTAGQSGQIPQFIYINTNDTLSKVTEVGYLNNLPPQGFSIADTDMALVVYNTLSPVVVPQTALFYIIYSAGNWSLVQYGTSSPGGDSWNIDGNDLVSTGLFGTTSAVGYGFIVDSEQWLGVDPDGFLTFTPAAFSVVTSGATSFTTQSFTVVSTGAISISTDATFIETTITIANSTGDLNLEGVTIGLGDDNYCHFVNIGNVSFPSITTIAGSVILADLGNTVQTNVVGIDISTGILYYQDAGSGGASWLIGGNSGLSDPAVFGDLTGVTVNFQTAATTFLSVDSTQNATWTLTTGVLNTSGIYSVNAGDEIAITSTAELKLKGLTLTIGVISAPVFSASATEALTIGAGSPTIAMGGTGITATTIFGSIKAPNLASTVQTDLLGFNTSTGLITHSPIATIIGNNFWKIGGNSAIGADGIFGTLATTTFSIVSKTNGTTYQTITSANAWTENSTAWAHTSTGAISLSGTTTALSGFTSVTISSPGSGLISVDGFSLQTGTVPTTTLVVDASQNWDITAENFVLNIGISSSFTLNGLLSTTSNTTKLLVIDTSTNTIGESAFGVTSWFTVTATSQNMVPGIAYVCGNASLITFTLPAITFVGAEFHIQGNSAGGWTVVYSTGQNIQIGNVSSTVTSGSVSSTNRYDALRLVCVGANNQFNAEFVQGSLNIA